MRIETDIKLNFEDVLLRPKRSVISSRSEVDLTRTFKFLHSQREWSGIPIMAANMTTIGTFEMALALEKHQIVTALHKHYSISELETFYSNPDFNYDYVFYSVGMQTSDLDKLEILKSNSKITKNLYQINVDVPNGYSENFVEYIKSLRQKFPDCTISAGNVCTGEMTEALILAGADICKIGIGGGSACLTRLKTNVGYPQLSAIIECADAAHGVGGHIIGDGGIVNVGDFASGFAGGADFLMAGSMFSGHLGQIHEIDGKQYLEFYGMSSKKANDAYAGGLKKYRTSEGRELLIPYRGPLDDKIQDILGGLRSTGAYIGATSLKNFSKCATFIRVQGSKLNTSLAKYDA